MAKVFFGSPINGQDVELIKKRYTTIACELQIRGHHIINPFDHYEKYIVNSQEDPNKYARSVVEGDLNILRKADILLVDASQKHSYVGCICEMVYAKLWKIPVIAYIGRNNWEKRPFFAYHCNVICRKKTDALKAVDQCKEREKIGSSGNTTR